MLKQKDDLVVPTELSFGRKKHAGNTLTGKANTRYYSTVAGGANPGDTTTFMISGRKAFDPMSVRLSFGVTKVDTGGVPRMYDDWAGSLIERVTVRSGTTAIDTVYNFNRNRNFMSHLMVSQGYKRGFGTSEGYWDWALDERSYSETKLLTAANDGDPITYDYSEQFDEDGKGLNMNLLYQTGVSTTQSGTGNTMWYCVPLDLCALFSQPKFIYLPLFGETLYIDIQWATTPNTWSGSVSAGAAAYTIAAQSYITVETMVLSDIYTKALLDVYQSAGITMDVVKWFNQVDIIAGSATTQDIRMIRKFSSVKSIFAVFYQPSLKSNDATDNPETSVTGKTSRFMPVGITNYQFFIDDIPLNPVPIEVASRPNDAMFEVMKAVKTHGDVSLSTGMSRVSFTQTSPRSPQHFIIGVDCENGTEELSGRIVTNNITLRINRTATTTNPATRPIRCYLFVQADTRLLFTAGSVITVIE